MKKTNLLIAVVVIALLSIAWFSVITATLSQSEGYASCVTSAEENVEAGLYAQAVKHYKEALAYGVEENIYLQINAVYKKFYAEEHTAAVRSAYLNDMATACQAFPENELFWIVQAELYMETNDLNSTYDLLEDAKNKEVSSVALDELHKKLSYLVKTDFKVYSQVKTMLNGWHVVLDGEYWKIVNNEGEDLTDRYQFISLLNENGVGLYTNSIDTRLMDNTLTPRARFDISVEDAGTYNGNVDVIPVKANGIWKYMKSSGEFLPGEFDIASSFSGTQAVACAGGQWLLLNEKGEQTDLARFEDIKLDLQMAHIQGNVILAKENGKYHIYNTNFEQISDFEADNIDLCINNGAIAFEKDGLWGFANTQGNILVEPQYLGAKSFSNGFAAVCNEEGLWGFLNGNAELAIEYAYLDALYFNSGRTCWVSKARGEYQLLHFVYD